ncbi:MAG: hypothetical protein O2854_03705 [Chloroflexi bacterium]|nr:hypothetical protein [Chloroflexota bacterium]
MQWLNKDLQRARTTDLADGGLPVVCSSMVTSTPCVTFTWQNEYEGVSTNHSASYSLVGNELLRTFDSSTHAVARRVEDVSFSQVGKLITVTMTSTDEGWADISKEFTHHFFMSSS